MAAEKEAATVDPFEAFRKMRDTYLGRPKTAGQWIGHFAMAIIALFLVWWMLRVYAH